MTEQSKRIILVAAPVLAWALSVGIGGNGFVSAFVCGIAFQYVRRSPDFRQELELVDDVAVLLTAAMWFVISGIGVLAVMSGGVSIGMVVFALLALTVVRLIPVLIAMLGSTFTWPERLLVGWLGPRGTTSIVFGLLAFNVLDGGAEKQVLLTTVLVVLGSVVLHGLSAPIVARAYARSHARQPGTADEHN
jgi:NhaP-type Na+/H+ or K+/H+ antiporter